MANRRRALSADRVEPQGEVLAQLVHALRDLRVDRPVVNYEQFKAPKFNGEGDIELFITQFMEVAAANQWNDMATLLHLRESLQESAKEYGRPGTTEAIFTALRSRYGLTAKEARSRLSNLKRDSRRSLHDHANDVEKLVMKAFEGLPEEVQNGMMLDTFCSSLGNAALQRHLLAIQPETMTAAVMHGNEYLQVKSDRVPTSSANVRALGDPDDTETVEEDPLAMLAKSIQLLTKKVEQMEQRASQPTKSKEKKCWGCQQLGHTRSECKTHPWTNNKSGNGDGPQ